MLLSTPRATFEKKLEKKPELRELLKLVVCGDEVDAKISSSKRQIDPPLAPQHQTPLTLHCAPGGEG